MSEYASLLCNLEVFLECLEKELTAISSVRLFLAGPVIIIATALSLIFTIGLGDNDARDGLSAYAVFNRGFERLLGEVDAEALMAQHLGGGLVGGLPRQEDDERDVGVPRRRRPNRANENHIGNNDNPEANDNNNENNNNRARKSGKKARRRDVQQRRDIQTQREAAAALGMQIGDEAAMGEQIALQRLIEEQVAAENRHNEE